MTTVPFRFPLSILSVSLALLGAREARSDTALIDAQRLSTTNPTPEFAYTNKADAHFTQSTGRSNTRRYHGLVVHGNLYVSNISLIVGDQSTGELNQNALVRTDIFPDRVLRSFLVHNGTVAVDEEILLPDGKDALLVRYTVKNWRGFVQFRPDFDMRSQHSVRVENIYNYRHQFDEQTKTLTVEYPPLETVALASNSQNPQFVATDFSKWNGHADRFYSRDMEIHGAASAYGSVFQPGAITGYLAPEHPLVFAFSVENDRARAQQKAQELAYSFDSVLEAKRRRLLPLLASTTERGPSFTTGNERFNRALQWAKVAGNGMVMDLAGPGIMAGLHWFNEYWGRDAFISLPGILLVTGEFETARSVIRNFFRYQENDASSPFYGRIPNRYRPEYRPEYNTADGLPWLIRELYEYLQYTGDLSLAEELFPNLKRAISGEAQRMDAMGFSRHGDQETWMDAKLGSCVVTPRGDRAVEIQALWYTALQTAKRVAMQLGRTEESKLWGQMAVQLRQNFNREFWNQSDNSLFDHITANNQKSLVKRPNAAWAISVPLLLPAEESLLSPERERQVVADLFRSDLIVPWGVRSMAPQSRFFNPTHLQLGYNSAYAQQGWIGYHPYYLFGSRTDGEHRDWAYHTGTVWPFLSGPVISSLTKQGDADKAWNLTNTLVESILSGATLGTLTELKDGDSANNPLGWDKGAMSQTWSVAEFVRNFYQSYLGIAPRLLEKTILVAPVLPRELGSVSAEVKVGAGLLFVQTDSNGRHTTIRSQGISKDEPLVAIIRVRPLFESPEQQVDRVLLNGNNANYTSRKDATGHLTIEVKTTLTDGQTLDLQVQGASGDTPQ